MVVSQEMLSRADDIADRVSFPARSRRFSRRSRRIAIPSIILRERERKTARVKSLVPSVEERTALLSTSSSPGTFPYFHAYPRSLANHLSSGSCETRGAIKRSRRAFFRRSSKLQVMNSTGVFGNLEQRIIREQSRRKRAVFLLFLFLPITYRYHLYKQISIFSHLHMSTM